MPTESRAGSFTPEPPSFHLDPKFLLFYFYRPWVWTQPQPSTGGRPPADENGRKTTPAAFWPQDQPKLCTRSLGALCGASAGPPSPGMQTVRKGGLTTGQTLTTPTAPWGWLEPERRLGGLASRRDQVPPLPPLGGVGGAALLPPVLRRLGWLCGGRPSARPPPPAALGPASCRAGGRVCVCLPCGWLGVGAAGQV